VLVGLNKGEQSVERERRITSNLKSTVSGRRHVNRICSDFLFSMLSEATNLRMQLRIIEAKGHKDRYVPLSPRLLAELRDYWKIGKPTQFIFPGRTDNVPLSGATIQRTCKMAAAQAHIKKLN
jgi:integrase